MIKKAVIIIILVASLLMPVANADIFSVRIEPEYDGHVNKTMRNDTGIGDRTYSNNGFAWRSFFEWDLSILPLHAEIINISYHWSPILDSSYQSGDKLWFYTMDSQPSITPDIPTGNENLYYSIENGQAIASNIHKKTYIQNWTDILNFINISKGWFSFGTRWIRAGTTQPLNYYIASSRSDDPSYMWITYDIPYIDNTIEIKTSYNGYITDDTRYDDVSEIKTACIHGSPNSHSFFEWDLSSIPPYATINSVSLYWNRTYKSGSYGTWNIVPLSNQPSLSSNEIIYNECEKEEVLLSIDFSSGANKKTNWDIVDRIQDNLSRWFAFGCICKRYDFSGPDLYYYISSSFDSSPPYLKIEYSHPPVIEVDINGTTNYTSIQDACDNATEGEMIFIHKGKYVEDIDIDEYVTLYGEDEVYLIGDVWGHKLLTIKNMNIYNGYIECKNIYNCSIHHSLIECSENIYNNIIINSSIGTWHQHTVTKDNKLYDSNILFTCGRHYFDLDNNTINDENITILNSINNSIIENISGQIICLNSHNITIKNINTSYLCFVFINTSNLILQNITINGNNKHPRAETTFSFIDDSNVIIRECNINPSCFIINNSNTELYLNILTAYYPPRHNDTAIYFSDGTSKIYNNTIIGGIILGSSNSQIYNNTILNKKGVSLCLNRCTNTNIYNNYLCNAEDDSVNHWNVSKYSGTNIIGGSFIGGNYWTLNKNYTDINNDGLSETPFAINHYNSHGEFSPITYDFCPLMYSEDYDLNDDEIIDVFDIAILASYLGTDNENYDYNNNGLVDVFDLSILWNNRILR